MYMIKYYCSNAGIHYWIEDIKTQAKLKEEVRNLHLREIMMDDISVYKVDKLEVEWGINFSTTR